jgi:hypothetical protein
MHHSIGGHMDKDFMHGLHVVSEVENRQNSAVFHELLPFKRTELILPAKSAQKIGLRKCLSTINFLNFIGSHIFAHVVHPANKEEFLLKVYPEPCHKDDVTCKLPGGSKIDLQVFQIKNIIVDNGKYLFYLPVITKEIKRSFFTVQVQNACYKYSDRSGMRIPCLNVEAEITHGDLIVRGILEDFNPNGMRILLENQVKAKPFKISNDSEITIKLIREGNLIFWGNCQYIRSSDYNDSIIFRPLTVPRPRFKGRKNRNPRVNLVPSPKVVFNHPFNNKTITYEISDITTSGFSLRENKGNNLLMPGMIIPSLMMHFADGMKIECSAQVVYSTQKRFQKEIHHGLSIIDMDLKEYNKLFGVVSNAYDSSANTCSEISMEELWEFFFDSGFIYGEKYEHLSLMKEKFKNTYQNLYHHGQEIFIYFTYQKYGRIYGHNCSIRAYQRAWMIHHLAARSSGARRIGLDVQRHTHYYFDGMYRLPSISMDYIFMYYRPNNKFPDYLFGGFYRDLKNPEACSVDIFTYLTYQTLSMENELDHGWTIEKCTADDIVWLNQWYSTVSGGLTINIFGFDKTTGHDGEPIEEMYSRIGLKRLCTPYVLKFDGKRHAYLIVDQSDVGLNLSELLNSIKIFVIEPDLPWEILQKAVISLKDNYETSNIPLLVYPNHYIGSRKIPYEKEYCLWVLDTKYSEEYIEYMKQILKFRLLKYLIKTFKVNVLNR